MLATPSDSDQYRRAVEGLHGGRATLDRVERVAERHRGALVWEGDIYVFSLEGHPSASRCYAWSEVVPDSERRRFFAVLHEGPVSSPTLALRASIVKDVRDTRTDSESLRGE